ncbi:MAG: penicillin-binding protein 2 [Candidatus Caldatribacteriota bacterium]
MKDSYQIPQEIEQRINWLLILIIISFLFLLINLWHLQIIRGGEFQERAVKNCIRSLVEEAPRGQIYDTHGDLLVNNRPNVIVSIIPAEVDNLEDLSIRLSKLINLSSEEIIKKVNKNFENPYKAVKIFDDCPQHIIIEIEENKDKLKGVILEVYPRRNYIYQELAANCLGYVGEINKEELERSKNSSLQGGDIIGKAGLEKYYEEFLRGEKGGKEVEVDALGREVATLLWKKPVPGNDLILTIDKDLQRFGEKVLTGKNGSIILSNPQNGEILALINQPTFNPNQFANIISYEDWQRLSTDPDYPLTNRAVQNTYQPGSTFKIVTGLAALEEGISNSTRKIYCSGKFTLKDQVFSCWKKEGHGSLSFVDALAQSCNIYFYTLGMELGINRMEKYMQKLGLGEEISIDLPEVASGIRPSAQWKQRELNEIWFPGDDINLSIGQGYLLVSPLQMHSIICAVATEGLLYRLHLVKQIISAEGQLVQNFSPELSRRIDISKQTFKLVKEGLRATIVKGTGWRANSNEISIAGKTGTAQNPHGENHAWFVGFAPYEDPEICITVFLENGGEGGEAAAPIAREILEYYFRM